MLTLTPVTKLEADGLTVEELNRYASGQAGRFVLSGVVVDEDGNKLNGVTVKLIKALQGKWGQEPKFETEAQTVNGDFKFNLRRYASIEMHFSLHGYYEEKLFASMPAPNMDAEQLAGLKPIPEPIFTRDKLRVVLDKKGAITHLIECRVRLECPISGTGDVMDFDSFRRGRSAARKIQNILDPKLLPANSAYITADLDAGGSFATIQDTPPNSAVLVTRPRTVRLTMNAKGDGFIKFLPKSSRNVYRQMKTAPEKGYQGVLVLDEEFFRQQSAMKAPEDYGLYFYFKTKDKYGKGRISAPIIQSNAVRMGVIFRFQPDETRNVETEENTRLVIIE
jgi:hypothetical protein